MLGGRWRVVPPQVLDQPSSGNGGSRVQDQVSEQCPLFRPAQPQDPCSVRDLNRPEDAEREITNPPHGSKLAPGPRLLPGRSTLRRDGLLPAFRAICDRPPTG